MKDKELNEYCTKLNRQATWMRALAKILISIADLIIAITALLVIFNYKEFISSMESAHITVTPGLIFIFLLLFSNVKIFSGTD